MFKEKILSYLKSSKYAMLVLGAEILAVLSIAWPWFLKPGYLFFTDFVWGPNMPIKWYDNWFFLDLAVRGAAQIIPVDFLQKVFICLVLFVVVRGAHHLVREIILIQKKTERAPSSGLVFILSLFALFNPFVYDRVMYGQFNIVAALGFMCLALACLLSYIRSNKLRAAIGVGVFSGLTILFSMHFIFPLALLVLLLVIYTLLKKQINWKQFLKVFGLTLFFIITINLNWLLGLTGQMPNVFNAVTIQISSQDLVAFQTSGKTGGEAITNVLMMSGFWGKDQRRYADLTSFGANWGRSFFLLLPLILYGVWLGFRSPDKKKRGFTLGLIILFAVSAFLAIGIRTGPTKAITLWLFDHLPFYRGLRETQKWVALEVVIYLIFLSCGAKELFCKKPVVRLDAVFKIVLVAIIVMQAPLLLWGFGGQIRPTKYPADWYQADSKISATGSCQGNILFLPWHAYMSFNWIGNIVSNPAKSFFSCPTISGTNMEWKGIYDNSGDKNAQQITKWLVSGGQTNLLTVGNLNVNYIVLAKELDWQNYLSQIHDKDFDLIQDSATLLVYRIKK
ncbi:MAG: hypothetical protein WC516_00960 [Patescibacteria group bacterium]